MDFMLLAIGVLPTAFAGGCVPIFQLCPRFTTDLEVLIHIILRDNNLSTLS